MSTDDNKALVRRVYDAINAKDPGALDGLMAADMTSNTRFDHADGGLEGFKESFLKLSTWLERPLISSKTSFVPESLSAAAFALTAASASTCFARARTSSSTGFNETVPPLPDGITT